MFLRNPFDNAFGLDIGDLSLKLVQLQKHHMWGRPHFYSIKEIRSLSLAPGYIVDGEIQQPEMVRKKILQLLGKEKGKFKAIKTPWVVADLPEPKTFLKIMELEASPDELTSDDIIYQARKHIPFDPEEAYIDWQIINSESNTNESKVLISSVPKVIADSYTYLLESAGLQPIALEAEAVPIARTLVTADKDYQGEARALLDLGATRSCLVIYDHYSLQFSTSINFSGELMTTAIAQALKIEHDRAEDLKKKYGISYNKKNHSYLKVVSDLAGKLITDIKAAISFYQEHFNSPNPVTHITMTGGVAKTKNLGRALSTKLKISAQPGNSWKNLGLVNLKPEYNENGVNFASAIGLALRAAQKPW